MYKKSVRRAYFGISPHLWPFAAWRMLVAWAAVGIVGALGAAYVGGADLNPLAAAFVGLIYAIWVAFYLLIPAAVLAIFDLVIVRRPQHRPAKYNANPRRVDRQSFTAWAGYAATLSTLFGVAYLFVYLNAFAPHRSFQRLLEDHLLRFAIGGAGAGLGVAWFLNVLHNRIPTSTVADHLRRGAFLWSVTVAGFATIVLVAANATIETTVLPGAMLAVIGAAVIPQLAVTPPTDLSQIPPPQLPDSTPSAPSSGPSVPEGGSGEGARGDWRTAPPPAFPSQKLTHKQPDPGAAPGTERNRSWITP